MHFNANGERGSRVRWKEMYRAFQNRQELIREGFTRRDLMRMGLLTGGGTLVALNGLSSRAFAWGDKGGGSCSYTNTGCGNCASPFTTPWTLDLPIPPVRQPIPLVIGRYDYGQRWGVRYGIDHAATILARPRVKAPRLRRARSYFLRPRHVGMGR